MANTLGYTREEDDGRHVAERWTGTDTHADVVVKAGTNDATGNSLGGPGSGKTATTGAYVPEDRPRELRAVEIHYSAAVTVDATVILRSGAGSAFDTKLATISFTGNTDGTYQPTFGWPMMSDDFIEVKAPDGGGAVVCGVTVKTDVTMSI